MLFLDRLLSTDVYTKRIQINTVLIFVIRGASIVCNFLLIPMTLRYLDKVNYGVWLTLTSISAWLAFMDIGVGNGLRNKLAESIEKKDDNLSRQYISTSYFLFSIIIGSLLALFAIVNPFIPWNHILKTDLSAESILLLTYIVVISFGIRMVLDLAGTIVVSLHKPFIKTFVDFLFNALTLAVVWVLAISKYKSFLLFGAVVSLMPVVVLAGFTYFLFRSESKYHSLRPSIVLFKKEHIRVLLNIGVQFFLIQITSLIIFSTSNVLITQLFSPVEVTDFNIAYKYFGLIGTVFGIILIPYWSSFTSAFVTNRLDWIRNALKKLIFYWGIIVFVTGLFVVAAPYVYLKWVGESIQITTQLNIWIGIYSLIFNWNSIFATFLNGVTKIRLQLYGSVFMGIVNVPLCYFLAKYTDLGVSSVIVANSVSLLIGSFLQPIQSYKIVTGTAKGIWNR